MGFWTDGHNFETVFQNPLPQTKSNKKGVGKNSRAFRLGRTESIHAVFFTFKSIDLVSQKGVDAENGLLPVNVFFFLKFTTGILPVASFKKG